MKTIRHSSGSEAEISVIENKLIEIGYNLVNKSNDKDLESFEYFKNSYSGIATLFEGSNKYQITWVE